jgi:copper amine oxidase-like protein
MQARLTARALVPVLLGALSLVGVREATAQRERVLIPENTVVHVQLDDRLSSRTAAEGDRFTAILAPEDRSGFPEGTRFEGVVTEVERAAKGRPGVLDMEFRRAVLPDGRTVSIYGDLASLSDDDLRRTSDGRYETRRRGDDKEKFDLKWVGYGAGAGAVLATIFGGNFLKGALLGGLGGAVYGYLNRDRATYREVDLTRGTEFGIRIADRVAFDDRASYRYGSRDARLDDPDRRDLRDERVLGRREEFRYGNTVVFLDGRRVELGESRPINLNGVLYVPLLPIADAANMRVVHRLGEDSFVLHTRGGPVEAITGETRIRMRNGRDEELEAAAVSIDGEIYVPTEYLSRVADLDVNWNRRDLRLDLETFGTRSER